MTARPLDLVSTAALLDALERRYDTFIFAGRVDRDKDTYTVARRSKGDHYIMAGLAYDLANRAMAALEDHVTDDPEGLPDKEPS